jgi:dCMP deaminase
MGHLFHGIYMFSPRLFDSSRRKKLASLASLRSNCMKRRVGAVIVRNNRVISTGFVFVCNAGCRIKQRHSYNGTARGLRNCNEGGCSRCNSGSSSGSALDECVCLHAEENALLEAGRERIGSSSILYCNTLVVYLLSLEYIAACHTTRCPCLRCTVKIIQIGITEVVYNLSYKVFVVTIQLFPYTLILL